MRTFAHVLTAIVIAATTVGPVSAATVPVAPATTIAQAGATATTVGGAVKDDQGAPIANAAVTLTGPSTYKATSDAAGNFSIAGVQPGFYTVTVVRAGFDTARDSITVLAGQPQQLVATLHIATLTSLRTIASVRAVGRGTFNTSTAAINTVPAASFEQQGQPQVTRVINEIPGVQISFPGTSANGAVPGAITFPNIRGGLSFETATLIDGHPLSVGTFGDYVTTFLNSYLLSGTDVIKGPGATSPEVNYAINGTVNFRTKDPTATIHPEYTFGFTNHGGTYYNLGVSDTILNGRLGFVLDLAGIDDPSALNNDSVFFNPNQNFGATYNGTNLSQGTQAPLYVPNTQSKLTSSGGNYTLVACCDLVSGNFDSRGELMKLRYKLSNATTATFTYLGSQTWADQNGNTSSMYSYAQFQPTAGKGYSGSINPGPFAIAKVAPGGPEQEINNEPILQGEIRTTLNNDTILARYYHAGIDRLIYQGGPSPGTPDSFTQRLWGVDGSGRVFNGQPVTVTYYDFFQQSELDALSGLSLEWDHPIGTNNTLSFAVDSTNSTTTSYSVSPSTNSPAATASFNISLPTGSGQRFNTYLLRDRFTVNDKLSGVLALYDNTYRSTAPLILGSAVDGSNTTFGTNNTSHFDGRLGLEFRPNANTAVRFSVGSSIAPPYLNLLSARGTATLSGTNAIISGANNVNLLPETAFGYDLGADFRLKNNYFAFVDGYMTNEFNHFMAQTFQSPYTCATLPSPYVCPGGAGGTTPVYFSSNINLSNSRYEGIEAGIKKVAAVGLNGQASFGLNHSYAYNLPPNFYCAFVVTSTKPCIPANYNTNQAIIPGQQLTEGPIGFGAYSNQNVPIFQGNGELTYRWANGAFATFGTTWYGKNNSLNAPPFTISYASVRYPIMKNMAIQISGDNIFNQLNSLFPSYGGGVPLPIAGGGTNPNPNVPQQAGTELKNLGPATWRFELTHVIGPDPNQP